MSKGNGISLIDLYTLFPDNDTAERWFEENRWGKIVDGLPGRTPGLPESIYCPHCSCSRMISDGPTGNPSLTGVAAVESGSAYARKG